MIGTPIFWQSRVSLKVKFTEEPRGRGTWKLNNSLLSDVKYVDLIKECIRETINMYAINPDEENKTQINFHIEDELF